MAISSYDLCGPDPKPMSKREVECLKGLCKELPRNPVIVQIGAERGVSTLAMLEERPDAFIFSIDVGVREEEYANLKKAELTWQRVVRGLGTSQSIGMYWPDGWRCHLLYVDGDHRRPGIDTDVRLWMPKVADGGIAAFHDYIHPDDRGPQIHGRVWEAIQEGVTEEVVIHVDRLIAFRCWDKTYELD